MNILILGPVERNKNIISFLEGENTIFQTEEPISINYLNEENIDYLISNGYAPIIKEPIISEYKHKIINVHPTFLPYGRGIYPLLWNLLEGTPVGVTLHFIDEGIDSGDIIIQKRVVLNDNDTFEDAYFFTLKEAEKLFLDNWNNILSKEYVLISQDELKQYRNRNVSEKYLDVLSQCWNTKVKDVKKLAFFYKMNKSFINNLNNRNIKC